MLVVRFSLIPRLLLILIMLMMTTAALLLAATPTTRALLMLTMTHTAPIMPLLMIILQVPKLILLIHIVRI